MAKMTETQRGYFIRRVNDKIREEINTIKHKNSVKITEATEKGYKSYLNEVGVYHLMKRLLKLEKDQTELAEKLINIVKGIDESAYVYNGSHRDLSNWFKNQARLLVDKQFSETKAGARIKELEKAREDAEDYLYGLNSNTEVAQNLNKILNPTGVKFIEGSK
tara:strand:+ start:326 stop:814 length:489 start_codon:yes stop_codon:yes gene_type:complete